jgi:hypothetical protein
MSASLTYCRVCRTAKSENKRLGRREIRIYHKLLRRISKRTVIEGMNDERIDKMTNFNEYTEGV